MRIDKQDVKDNLNSFIQKYEDIELIIIDSFDFSFTLPSSTINILSTNTKANISGYEIINLLPLDFEEYILFHKFEKIENIFPHFIQDSTYPEIAISPHNLKIPKIQAIINHISKDETEKKILIELFQSMGLKLTIFQFFTKLKKTMKISKDKIYSFLSYLEEIKIIFLIKKYNTKNSPKKVQLIDFYLKQATSFNKNIYQVVENAVFLELIKKTNEYIFYSDEVNFILPKKQLSIIISLFAEKDIFIEKLKTNIHKFQTKEVLIIGISDQWNLTIQNIKFSYMPFYIFATNDF